MKLIIFGSTGDLIRRKVLPALQKFDDLEIFGIGRRDFNDVEYQNFICENCNDKFKRKLRYKKINFEINFSEDIQELFDKDKKNFVYISINPQLIAIILEEINKIAKKGVKVNILIEKPFGYNLDNAVKLKRFIEKNNLNILLSDHYLFKKNVINLKKTNFKQLKIVSLENIGIEGRRYYDSIGALKDMIQSHFLNILFKLCKFRTEDLEIVEFKEGQYDSYNKELGEKSNTETFARVKLKLGNRKIEFVTGKGFERKTSYILIDDKKIELDTKENPYKTIFNDFFSGKRADFPTIDNAIRAWKIIKKIEKKKGNLVIYPRGLKNETIINAHFLLKTD